MPKQGVKIANPLPNANNQGIRYPRWHSKHPSNGIVASAVVVPTVKRGA